MRTYRESLLKAFSQVSARRPLRFYVNDLDLSELKSQISDLNLRAQSQILRSSQISALKSQISDLRSKTLLDFLDRQIELQGRKALKEKLQV